MALELAKGPIVYALRKYDFLVLFPINPATLAKYREAFKPSRAKDDPIDAELAFDLLLRHPERFAPLKPQSVAMRILVRLTEQRRELVDARPGLPTAWATLLPAAVGGLGVVLARTSLVAADLKSGRLVRLFSRRVAAPGSFFIVYEQGSEHFEKIQKFQQWLLEQARLVGRESAVRVQVGQDATHRAPRRLRHRCLQPLRANDSFGSAHLESRRSAQGRKRWFDLLDSGRYITL